MVDPEIARGSRSVVIVEKAGSVGAESGVAAGGLIHAFGNRKLRQCASCDLLQVNVFVAVDVRAEGDALAIGRELVAADFPIVFGEPGYFFCRYIREADVLIAV